MSITYRSRWQFRVWSSLALWVVCGGAALAAETLAAVSQVGESRIAEGRAAQEKINSLADQASSLEAQYRQVTKVVDDLKVYNNLLAKQVTNQREEIANLEDSITKVALLERQVLPLMMRMIDSLEEFVRLDVPFLPEERADRLTRLRDSMERSDVTPAEKFRQVMEAYEIENDYGRTIESYAGSLTVEGGTRAVNFLRIGRVALLYQTEGGEYTGVWDRSSNAWRVVDPALYRKEVAAGIEIARKQSPPDLMVLPIHAAEDAS
ncbi:MAG: DUF3450 domain-containing protein [Pseudomonadota bacterium]